GAQAIPRPPQSRRQVERKCEMALRDRVRKTLVRRRAAEAWRAWMRPERSSSALLQVAECRENVLRAPGIPAPELPNDPITANQGGAKAMGYRTRFGLDVDGKSLRQALRLRRGAT